MGAGHSEGRIPHSKLGSIVRFKKDEIDRAIKEGLLKTKNPESGKREAVSKVSQKSPKKS